MASGSCNSIRSSHISSHQRIADTEMIKNATSLSHPAGHVEADQDLYLGNSSQSPGEYRSGTNDNIEYDVDSINALHSSFTDNTYSGSSNDLIEQKYHIDCFLPKNMTPDMFWSSMGNKPIEDYPRLKFNEWYRMVEVRAGVRNTFFGFDPTTCTQVVHVEDTKLEIQLDELVEYQDGLINPRGITSPTSVTASGLAVRSTQHNTAFSTPSENKYPSISTIRNRAHGNSTIFEKTSIRCQVSPEKHTSRATRKANNLDSLENLAPGQSKNDIKRKGEVKSSNLDLITSSALVVQQDSSHIINQTSRMGPSFHDEELCALERLQADHSRYNPEYSDTIWRWSEICEKA